MGNSYQVYADIAGDTTQREHIEGTRDFPTGQKVIEYVKARIAPEHRVWGEFGARRADTPDFDFGRLREAANAVNP